MADLLRPGRANWLANRAAPTLVTLKWTNLVFAGDFGGYIGLLLGGSAISIVEVMDFFFYDCLYTLVTKIKAKKERKGTAPGHGAKDSPQDAGELQSSHRLEFAEFQRRSRPVYNNQPLESSQV